MQYVAIAVIDKIIHGLFPNYLTEKNLIQEWESLR